MRVTALVLASVVVGCGSGSSGGASDDVAPVPVAPGPAAGASGVGGASGGSTGNSAGASAVGGMHGGGTSSGGAGGEHGGGTSAGGSSSGGGSTSTGGAANGGAPASGGAPATGGGTSTGGACSDWSASVCHYAYTCEPALMNLLFGPDAECRVEFARYCEINRALPGANATDAQIEACAQAGANVTDCYQQTADPQCVFAGTSPDGTGCQSDWQCQSGNCRIANGTACGTCGSPADGTPCSSLASCDTGYFCAQNGTCTKIGGLGASCTMDDECSLTLVCTNGSCSVPPDMGQPCTTKCDLAKSLACDSQSKTCVVDTPTPSATLGQACGLDSTTNDYVPCDGSTWCDVPSMAQMGTCKARIDEGGACTDSGECSYPLDCVKGVCHANFMCP